MIPTRQATLIMQAIAETTMVTLLRTLRARTMLRAALRTVPRTAATRRTANQ